MTAKPNPLVIPLSLDAAAVRQLFQSEVLRRERPPPEAVCDRVAAVLNDRNRIFRLMSGPLPILQGEDQNVKAFQAAADAFRLASERVQQSYENRVAEFMERAPTETVRVNPPRPWESQVFQKLYTAISEADAYVSSRVFFAPQILNWALEVGILGVLFDEAMDSVEPGKSYGNASDGPRLRFLRLGLKLIAEIDMTEDAIKTRMGRIEANRNN